MTRIVLRFSILATAIGLTACDLEVRNPNDPETDRVLATPEDVESLLGSYYRRWHSPMYSTINNIWGMANVQSFENYSSLLNEAQNTRAGIPRPPNDNTIGNVANSNQQRTYFTHGEVNRIATNIMRQLNGADFTLGSPARDFRAKAFAEFLRGVSLGYLALFYDSAAVVHEDLAPDDGGVLVGYREVMDSAVAALARATAYADDSDAATGEDGFPLPPEWIPSTTSFTVTEFKRLVRSYSARFRAGVARTPAERADVGAGGIVNWGAVILDAQNGIQADHDNITNTTTGPEKDWVATYQGTFREWHQMPPWVIGMGDTTGSYATWMALPLDARGADGSVFFMATPDLRFPQGGSRTAQQADVTLADCDDAATKCKRYFRNRPTANDVTAGLSWGFSQYDIIRFYSWFRSGDAGTGQNGAIVFFTRAENDLLEAEGHLRKATPDYAAAAALINRTRAAGLDANGKAIGGGLPPITVFNAVAPVPGGSSCVPKVPVSATSAGGGTLTCGNMMEALKWEKRIETAYTHYAGWFIDMRGWGDLASGTPLHWAPPYQDLQARRVPIYSTGVNTAGGMAAAAGTYGW